MAQLRHRQPADNHLDARPHARAIDLRQVRSVAVLGAGGHGRELADIVRARAAADRSLRLLGIADDGTPDLDVLGNAGIPFLGTSADIADPSIEVYIGVGMPDVRYRLAASFNTPPALVHPHASIGTACSLERGSVIAQGAILTTNVRIGRHTHVNIGATISHDCDIDSFVTICPGVTLTGNVRIDSGSFIGAGATVLPGVHIGADAVVGAGAVVTADVAPRQCVAGLPARPLR